MPKVLHIIQSLSLGGASRAAIATAKYSQIFSNDHFQHQFLCLEPPETSAWQLAKKNNIQVIYCQDRQSIQQIIEQASIVHCHYWNNPTIYDYLHNDLPAMRLLIWFHIAGDHPPQMITKKLIDYADVVIPCNPYSFNLPLLKNLSKTDKVHMIYDGTDFARLNNLQKQAHQTFNVGYIGTVDFVKMHPKYITMSASINIPNIKFIVCGDGIQNLLYEQAKELNSETKFAFLGHVEEIKSIIEKLDVYGYPLCEDTYAAAELNLQEAMYGGIPPVVFPYGGIKSLIHHEQTGLIVHNQLEYKQAIEYLYYHPEFREQLGKNARQYAIENFGAENAAKQLNPVYENLLNSPKRKRLWGLSVDINLLNQPIRLSDLNGDLSTFTGAELFIESLGDQGKQFEISLNSKNLTEILEAEANIAKSSPVLCHQYGGGIIHYKNSYPQDSYLKFWSGLVFYHQGKYQESWQELTTAINLGFCHERINWYLTQVAEKLGDFPTAKIYLDRTLAWQPNLSTLPQLKAIQERLTNQFTNQFTDQNREKTQQKLLTIINKSPLPVISIVTPSFNQGEFLEECIDSILSQNYPNLEYVIMDGGSTDQSLAIMQKYEKYLSYWQSQSDGGQYLAINDGFAHTNGEIMAWLNADDKYHPEALFKVAFTLEKYPQIEWLMGQPTQWNRSGKLVYVVPHIPGWSRDLLLSKQWLKNDQWIQQESTFWRRSLWLKSGGKLRDDIKLAGDFELWLRFSRFAQLFVLLEQIGGFRSYPEQRSKQYFQEYLQEIDQLINEENFLITSGQYNTFLDAPNQINITGDYHQAKLLANPGGSSQNIKVSAIVSTYNSESFFAGCLEDLVNQTLYQVGKLEIIIIDSNSSENEGAIARQYQARYSNIIYQRTEQRETIYSAWNRGIKLAQGKYITNANTDDRHRPDALEMMANYLDQNIDTAVIYADQLITNKINETWLNTSADQHWNWPEFDYTELEKRCILGSQPMWRKSLHEKYGDFRPEFHVAGDYEFWLRIGKKEKITRFPDVLGLYFDNSQGLEKSSSLASQETYTICREYGIIQRHIKRKTTIPTSVSAEELAQLKSVFTRQYFRQNLLDTPLISIIITCYNHGKYLPEAVVSIVEQTYHNWECLIIDDGSIDETILIAEHLINQYSEYSIKLLKKAHSGVIETRNLGLSQCVGQYILFVDADDRIHVNFLQESLEILQANPPIGFVYTDITEFGVRNQIVSHGDFQPAQFLQLNQVPITALFRREIYQQIGGFKKVMEAGWEDWEFWLSAYELGWQGYRLTKPYLYYRQHSSGSRLQNFSSSQENIRLQKARIITLHPRLYADREVQIAQQILKQNQMLDISISDNIDQNIDQDTTQTTDPSSNQSVKLINMTITFPAIAPVSTATKRPFWSIMIPTFNPNQYLEATLNSVISQISDFSQVQIEVIDDASVQGDVEEIVKKFQGYGVSLYRQPNNLGLVGNWNSCIARARGEWVHILHQDDLVLPGFYDKLQQGCLTADQAGAAFTRYYYMDAQGQKRSLANLERDTPGILSDWLEKIAVVQLIQFPAMVVKRSVYEKLGGFCPEAGYAADWEMWKRIAVYYPVWYEPEPLAAWRQHGLSTSRQAIINGTDIQDLAKSIRISATYLPADNAVTLSNQAQEYYALYALNSAQQLLTLNNHQGAIAQIQGALACSQSANVTNKLISILNPAASSAKSTTQVISPEAISQAVINLVIAYEKNPSSQSIVQQLREQRQKLAEIWLNLPTESLGNAYAKLQEAHQKLIYSSFKYELLTTTEIHLVEKIKRVVNEGFTYPQAVQYLLAGMLYQRADQLPINFINAPIPNWLVNDYLKFMFAAPTLFQKMGEANNYVVFLEKWLGYVLHNISNQPNSQIWQAIAQLFSQISNFIPVYFAESNLKNLYNLRAKILEFYLKNQGCVMDYDFPVRNRQKIRLGILCDHYNPLTETFLGLPTFEYLDRQKFEIILYCLQLNNHPLEQYCQSRADKLIKLPANLLDQVNSIRNDDLDILLVTTNVTAIAKSATYLMTHRLARIQTTVFASPVTTGIKNIDYFISGQLSEIPEQAPDFYTEKIKLLDGVGICFNYNAVPAQPAQVQPNRSSWGADEQTLIFISGANFYKIIPEQGETWAKILAQVPNSILVLYPFAPSWSRNYPGIPFMNRMHATLAKYGVDVKRLVIIKALPSRQDVKECLKLADIYLDSYPHSGGSSLIDPLEVGLPSVVRDGMNLRSKHGAGILRSLTLDDLIGQDENSYINIAVNLGKNQVLRQAKQQEIQAKMQQNPSFLDSRDYGQKLGNLLIDLFQEWQSIHAANVNVNINIDTSVDQQNTRVINADFLQQTIQLVNQFKQEPNNPSLIQELKQIRYQFATFWLQIPTKKLSNIYQGELKHTFQMLLNSGIQYVNLLPSEEAVLQQLTELSIGLIHPQAINAFLGGMLYFVPGKMLVKDADQRLPAWLIADYQAVFEKVLQENLTEIKGQIQPAETSSQILTSQTDYLTPELGNQIIGNINLYQIDQTDVNILNDLRKNRQQMVEICLNIPDQQLANAYASNLGKIYQLLLNSGLRKQGLLEDEQAILQNLATRLGNGLTAPQGINYLLATMLYCQPGQLQIEDVSQIPDWLQTDYQRFM